MATESKRWKEIKGVLQAALERAPSKRSDFVRRICAHDEALLEEVISLLAFESGEFLEDPALSQLAAAGLTDLLEVPAEEPLDALVGTEIGGYHILERIGGGGMGDVYKAEEAPGSHPVVLKLLPLKFVSHASMRRRFQREARAVSALDHPNVIRVLKVAEHQRRPLIIMEFLEGSTLYQMLSRGKGLGVARTIRLARQFAAGLSEAHRRGVLHRDLKPGNIIVDGSDHLKILDFGLAKLTDPEDQSSALEDSVARLTKSGEILGTISYMSPEQARGKPVDRRSDIFAFGCVVYEMLTGHKAFAGTTLADSVTALLFREPAPPRATDPDTPTQLEDLLFRALRKDPEERWESMSELSLALERIASDLGLGSDPNSR